MPDLTRNPPAAASSSYDLIVIGGGIYGAAMTLEATLRGRRPLLLERDDFGAATSWNSLRILHGGLRSLQTLDFHRFRESVSERRRFLRDLPDLVQPLPCLMPLYGEGMHRPAILRAALAANDFLSARRNAGVRADRRLPNGRILGVDATKTLFSGVRTAGLQGAALWHDAFMPASQRVLIEMLRWAAAGGATCLNYVEAESLLQRAGRVTAVRARDRESGTEIEFAAPVVVNCAGPECARLAGRFDRPRPDFFPPSLAFNLLLDRPAIAEVAVAVAPQRPGARTYFILPWHGRAVAGTFHAPFEPDAQAGPPTERQIDDFLKDLNDAVPVLACTRADVRWTFWGLLPAMRAGTVDLATRETIVDHGRTGGPRGLYSVSGVKFTTARLVAERTLSRVYGPRRHDVGIRSESARTTTQYADLRAFRDVPEGDSSLGRKLSGDTANRLRAWATEEAVVHLDDLLLRRLDWQADPSAVGALAGAVSVALGWDHVRAREETNRLARLGIACGAAELDPYLGRH